MEYNYNSYATTKNYVSISMQPEYRDISVEEMRFQYYQETLSKSSINDKPSDSKKRKANISFGSSPPLNKRAKMNVSFKMTEGVNKLCDDINASHKRILDYDDDEMKENNGAKCRKESDTNDITNRSMLLKKRRIRKSLKHNSDISEKEVRNIDDMRKKGNLLLKDGFLQEAYDQYTIALSNPKLKLFNSLTYSNRAFCLMKLNRFTDALCDCDNALACDKKNMKANLRKILCLMELDELSEAELLANDLYDEWQQPECLELLNIVQKRQKLRTLLDKAEELCGAKNFSLAYTYYNKAHELDPESFDVGLRKISILYIMERYSEALRDCNCVLTLDKENQSVLTYKARCLMKLERYEEADKIGRLLHEEYPSENEYVQLLKEIKKEQKTASNRNYYEILDVPINATVSEIKKRYRRLSLLYHPDKLIGCSDETARKTQEEKFKLLNLIYTTLSDSTKRQMYNIECGLSFHGRRY